MNLEKHKNLCDEIHKVCVFKNERYGDSFSNTVKKYGTIAALTRMSDKWQRIEQLMLHKGMAKGSDESLEDSLKDLANYCLMTVCELQEQTEDTATTIDWTKEASYES